MRTLVVSEFDAVTQQAVRQIGESHPHATFRVFRSVDAFKAADVKPYDYDLAVISGFDKAGVDLAWELSDRRPKLPIIGLNDINCGAALFRSGLLRNFTSLSVMPSHTAEVNGTHFGQLSEVVATAQRTATRSAPQAAA